VTGVRSATTARQSSDVVLGWASRITTMLVSLATVRFALQILGEYQFAVYQVIIAALGWLTLASLGLGPALKNLVSQHDARGEQDHQLRRSSAAIVGLLFVAGAVLLALAAPGATAGLLRRLDHDIVWASRAVLVGGLLSLITVLGQVSTEVLFAEFRARLVYLLTIAGSVLTLTSIVLLARLGRPPSEMLFWTVCSVVGPPALGALVAMRITRLFSLRLAEVRSSVSQKIFGVALPFWVFAALSNLVFLVDGVVISQVLNAQDIVVYSIMIKVAAVGIGLFATVVAVVWPEWTRNWERREAAQLRQRVLRLGALGVLVCVPAAAIGVFALPVLIRLWLPDARMTLSAGLILMFVAYVAVRFWTDVHTAALMSGNRIATATKYLIIQAIITAPLEYVFGQRWGAFGVILGLLTGYLATAAWMFPRRFYSEMRSMAEAPEFGTASLAGSTR